MAEVLSKNESTGKNILTDQIKYFNKFQKLQNFIFFTKIKELIKCMFTLSKEK